MPHQYAVIIPTYNRIDLLKEALGSVTSQTLLPHQILVIIDEPENEEKYSFLSQIHDSLEYHFTGGGEGPAGVRNKGLGLVDADYVFFLDDDDLWLPEKVEKQVAAIDSLDDHVGVFCDYLLRDSKGDERPKKTCQAGEVNGNINIHALAGSPSFMGYKFTDETRDLRFDENLPPHEDAEFYIRLAKYGKFRVVEECLAIYFDHGGARVSKGYDRTLKSLRGILAKHRDSFTRAEINWYQAKIYLYQGINSDSMAALYWNYFLYWHTLKYTRRSSDFLRPHHKYNRNIFRQKRKQLKEKR